MARAVHLYPAVGEKRWPYVREGLLRLLKDELVPQGSDQDVFADLVAEYLEAHAPQDTAKLSPADAQALAARHWPFVREDKTYVFLPDFARWAWIEHSLQRTWPQWAGMFVEVLGAENVVVRPAPGCKPVRAWRLTDAPKGGTMQLTFVESKDDEGEKPTE